MKILLIEDEPRLNSFLKEGMEQQGYSVDAAENGSTGLEYVSTNAYDLVVLDIMLPGQNGFEVLHNMRQFGVRTPVIIISALNSSDHVIQGLDAGAVDYLKKPFDFGEFLARIRAVTRKGAPRTITRYKVDQLELDLVSRKVWLDGKEVTLTNRELGLLELLMMHCNRVVSKTEIAEKVWDVNFDMGSNVIEVHISQLRRKLRDDIIHTRVGLGYVIEGSLLTQ
ncbi:MAG: response regulator transcription factor [Cyclobacteriaceae bacterium]|jgi:two-component system copper resistance phosphate regulon response regulator CusR|nr:DNA-binding response regulator [Cytophagales bacterium]HNP76549.1 response regulator transcription factor [Cyclobacteriaceae bacterium]HQQ83277.1 response regulator transcription factor [Cyclobacteriaceae bacterium]